MLTDFIVNLTPTLKLPAKEEGGGAVKVGEVPLGSLRSVWYRSRPRRALGLGSALCSTPGTLWFTGSTVWSWGTSPAATPAAQCCSPLTVSLRITVKVGIRCPVVVGRAWVYYDFALLNLGVSALVSLWHV